MKEFNLMESILNDYAMQGYKNMCKADAMAHIKLCNMGIRKFESKLEEYVCKNIDKIIDTDDDFVLYNKNNKDKNIIKMYAGLKNNRIIGYTIMEYRDYK
jgi:hypothetical protein